MSRRWGLILLHLLAAAPLLAVGGCAAEPVAPPEAITAVSTPAPPQTESNPNLDPTAIRLHDLAGALLEYYVRQGDFPAKLDALRTSGVVTHNQDLLDPVSGRPFMYLPNGAVVPGRPGRLIVCQPLPGGESGRWGLMIEVPRDHGHLITRVVQIAEPILGAAPAQP